MKARRRVKDLDGNGVLFREDTDPPLLPGEFEYTGMDGKDGIYGMAFVCPCGCGAVGVLSFEAYDNHPKWNWDGNEESPTLTPSVQRTGDCRWHGYLTNGEWISV